MRVKRVAVFLSPPRHAVEMVRLSKVMAGNYIWWKSHSIAHQKTSCFFAVVWNLKTEENFFHRLSHQERWDNLYIKILFKGQAIILVTRGNYLSNERNISYLFLILKSNLLQCQCALEIRRHRCWLSFRDVRESVEHLTNSGVRFHGWVVLSCVNSVSVRETEGTTDYVYVGALSCRVLHLLLLIKMYDCLAGNDICWEKEDYHGWSARE